MTLTEFNKDGKTFRDCLASVPLLSPEWRGRAVTRLNSLTKPMGSLGRLEEIGIRLVAIREEERPRCTKKVIFTLAADHGVTINVLSRHCGIEVVVVDIGVDGDMGEVANLVHAKVCRGTRNMAREPAMNEAELHSALGIGIELAALAQKQGHAVIGTGEMGIGNTTAASAITSVLTGRPVAQVTGRGTGLDGPGLKRKIEVIERALEVNRPNPSDPLDLLRRVGGLEIAGLTGLIVGAASRRIPAGSRAMFRVPRQTFACTRFATSPMSPSTPISTTTTSIPQCRERTLIEAAAKLFDEMATFSSAGVSEASA